MRLAFLDTETTSLRHDRRIWEIGLIIRDDDDQPGEEQEYRWFVDIDDLDLGNADLMSLAKGKFYERHPQAIDGPPPHIDPDDEEEYLTPCPEDMVMRDLERTFLRGATIVGAIPNFDTEGLAARMRAHGICPSWDHHLVDVESFAAGARRKRPPWRLDELLDLYGIKVAEADRHTALGDARAARDLYDAALHRILPGTGA